MQSQNAGLKISVPVSMQWPKRRAEKPASPLHYSAKTRGAKSMSPLHYSAKTRGAKSASPLHCISQDAEFEVRIFSSLHWSRRRARSPRPSITAVPRHKVRSRVSTSLQSQDAEPETRVWL